jgi:aminoglycoside 6'-N-acetyltransferase I
MAIWADMRHNLWPETDMSLLRREIQKYFLEGDSRAFVGEVGGIPAGFVEVSMRDYAPGCTSSPVPYIEGLWVAPAVRQSGIARKLVTYVEDLVRDEGHRELASDVLSDNLVSQNVHEAMSFRETARVVHYRKVIR